MPVLWAVTESVPIRSLPCGIGATHLTTATQYPRHLKSNSNTSRFSCQENYLVVQPVARGRKRNRTGAPQRNRPHSPNTRVMDESITVWAFYTDSVLVGTMRLDNR